MVQVDVFWGYGFGASLAVAAGRLEPKGRKLLESSYFAKTILFLALLWAPTGLLLLLRHPSWETMQVAQSLATVPPFLTLAFGITNVTQGILGYWVGERLMRAGQDYWANLNWLAGYFGMFFILVYGWDGLGYDRFFYDRDALPGSPAWTAGVATGATVLGTLLAAAKFLVSGVALTLYTDGIFMLPPFFYLFVRWLRARRIAEGRRAPSPRRIVRTYLAAVFAIGLACAIFSALVVNYLGAALGVGDHVARATGAIPARTGMHVLSYLLGLPVALIALWLAFLKPGRAAWRLLKPLHGAEPQATSAPHGALVPA